MAYKRNGNGKFSSHNTPIPGPKPGASMVNTDVNSGDAAHNACSLTWESATDAYSNKMFDAEYKPIQRGRFF